MSDGRQQSLFFIGLPDQDKLCTVSLSFQGGPETEDHRSRQIKTCRELVLLYSVILASPGLYSFTDIWLIMAVPFYKTGIIQAYGHRHNLQLGTPKQVLPGILQCCLSYTLTTRLAPCWNKAGPYLLSGKEFLTESGWLNAVSMELNANKNQLCIAIEANTVRLPPTKLEDFDFPPMVLSNFSSQRDCVLHTSSMAGSNWCYVLPSMKRGRIMSISHQLPADSPVKSYQDLQEHWRSLYGYCLPEQTVEEEVYCSVYFKLIGERLFTYPLSCIRLQPVSCCPRVNLQGALNPFISDLTDRLQSICGLPVHMTSKPWYPTYSLTSTELAQVSDGKPLNLTTTSSIRPVLTQFPAPTVPPVKPSFGLQLPGRPPASLQPGGVSCGEERKEGHQRAVHTYNSSQEAQTQSSGGEGARSSSASATTNTTSQSSSSSGQPSYKFVVPLKLVSIFTNRSRHINLTQLLAQKQQSQKKGEAEGERFESKPKRSRPTIQDVESMARNNQPNPKMDLSASQRGDVKSGCETQPMSSHSSPPPPAALFDVPSNKGGERFESRPKRSKPKRSRPTVQDVESMARNNQLFKVNSATLLAWLKERGVASRVKVKKEDLILRVMCCLANA